ncbi:MAG TPA: DUF1566 domain-containing protein [Geobacteraceae bacterium]|nr:DUF1566 domain-containing protein [Geobacteraceae bacterium]
MIIRLIALVFLFMLVTFTCHAAVIQLPQTGQTVCYGTAAATDGSVVSCTGTGQDGDTLAGVPWPSPRFVDNGKGTVTDNLTGLVWLKNSNCTETLGGVRRDITNTDMPVAGFVYKWLDALTWVANLGDGACGLTDGSIAGSWRMPNVNELKSLINLRQQPMMLSPAAPFAGQALPGYWTSDAGSTITNNYEAVGTTAITDSGTDKTLTLGRLSAYIWPVRDGATSGTVKLPRTGKTSCNTTEFGTVSCVGTGQDGDTLKGVAWPSPRFVDNHNGTVTDLLTSLIWTKKSDCNGDPFNLMNPDLSHGYLSLQGALAYVKNLQSGACDLNDGSGPGDWRLPNVNELYTLLGLENKRIPRDESNNDYFYWIQDFNWTSTTYFDPGSSKTYAYYVGMHSGNYHGYTVNGIAVNTIDGPTKMAAWPVRGGQVGDAAMTGLPAGKDFGTVAPGGSVDQTITIFNGGATTRMQVSAIILAGPDADQFKLDVGDGTGGTCGSTMPSISPGSNCTVKLHFEPSSFGVKTAILQIYGANNASVALSGTALINGGCGAADGSKFITAPTTGLCVSGTASVLSGTGPWTWNCSGLGGGTTAACSANSTNFAITFSAGAHGSLTGATAQTVNYGGSATTVTAVPDPTYAFVGWWEDAGLPGVAWTGVQNTRPDASLTVSNVTSNHSYHAAFAVNYGICGSSNGATFTSAPGSNLCAAGTATAVSGSGPWSWKCENSYGGSDASCSANIPTYTVTPSPGTNVTVTPATSQTVKHSGTASFTVSTLAGYGIMASGCKGAVSGSTFTTDPVTGDCTVSFTAVVRNADASGSGQPSLLDAVKSLQGYSGKLQLSAEEKIRYDVAPLGSNGIPVGNGVVDYADIILILRRSVGIGKW